VPAGVDDCKRKRKRKRESSKLRPNGYQATKRNNGHQINKKRKIVKGKRG
jgi:hypothetical protein